MERPKPLVPRHLRLGIKERIASDGSVLIPLDENSVKEAVKKCEEEKVEAIAIGFLHCYANDQHEKLAQSMISLTKFPHHNCFKFNRRVRNNPFHRKNGKEHPAVCLLRKDENPGKRYSEFA